MFGLQNNRAILPKPPSESSHQSITDTAAGRLARLDTLRAFAVSIVVLFHLRPDALPWGYIGVDLFFSLSGFLMTWLYLRNQADGRKISAGQFIKRRFWRIFPPLAVTVLFSLVGAVFLFAPEHLLAAAVSSIAALVSISNWVFFSEAGYFDTDAIFKPLLHTWSLGVEEQFYMLFALILLLTRYVPLWLFLGVIALVSLVLWGWVVLENNGVELPPLHDEPYSALFFLPQYRAFQFALGGLAAYCMLTFSASWRHWFGVSGLILLGLGFWIAADKGAAHLSAAVVAVGMALVMMPASILDRVGDWLAIRYLAQISYQLYLVHWPIIVFWHYWKLAPLGWGEAVICGLICLLLADLLYRITNPLRGR